MNVLSRHGAKAPRRDVAEPLNRVFVLFTIAVRNIQYAIGDGRLGTFFHCAAGDMSSLLRPNPDVLKLFHGFPAWAQVVGIEPIQTVRLDDVAETEGMTFLQLDI